MDITIQGSVDPNCIRLGKEFGVSVRTDEAAEDVVPRLNLDWVTSVVDGRGNGTLTMGAEGSVEPDAFHYVVQEFVVCFGAFDVGPLVDISEIFPALVR